MKGGQASGTGVVDAPSSSGTTGERAVIAVVGQGGPKLVRWVGVVGDCVLVEWDDERQKCLSVGRLIAMGWRIEAVSGVAYLVGPGGVRVYK